MGTTSHLTSSAVCCHTRGSREAANESLGRGFFCVYFFSDSKYESMRICVIYASGAESRGRRAGDPLRGHFVSEFYVGVRSSGTVVGVARGDAVLKGGATCSYQAPSWLASSGVACHVPNSSLSETQI